VEGERLNTQRFIKQQAYLFITRDEIDCDMANFCTNCGKKLSFLERHDNDTLCSECSATLADTRHAQLAQVEQSIAASRTTTSEQLTLLKTYDHSRYDGGLISLLIALSNTGAMPQ
jgi:uncharacterized protein with PIN domain